jgi:hypothetical protein
LNGIVSRFIRSTAATPARFSSSLADPEEWRMPGIRRQPGKAVGGREGAAAEYVSGNPDGPAVAAHGVAGDVNAVLVDREPLPDIG